MIEANWLQRTLDECTEDVSRWPLWMLRQAELLDLAAAKAGEVSDDR